MRDVPINILTIPSPAIHPKMPIFALLIDDPLCLKDFLMSRLL